MGSLALVEAYDYHRDALVELEYLDRIDFQFDSVFTNTPHSQSIWYGILKRECPDWVDAASPAPEGQHPFTVTIWCKPDHTEEWTLFFLRANEGGDANPMEADTTLP